MNTDDITDTITHAGATVWQYRWHIAGGVGLVVFAAVIYLLVGLGIRLPDVLVGMIATLSFMFGAIAFFGIPYLIPRSAARPYRHAIARFYLWLVRASLKRGGIVEHEHAGVELVGSTYDAEYGSERYKLGGEYKDAEDVAGRMQYWGNTPFFLTRAGTNTIFDPLDVAFGEARGRLIEAGENIVSLGDAGDCIAEHVKLPNHYGTLAIEEIVHLLGGSATPDQRELTEEFARKSQMQFKSANLIDMVTFVLIFGITLLFVFLAFDFAQSLESGGGVVSGITKGMFIYGGWLL